MSQLRLTVGVLSAIINESVSIGIPVTPAGAVMRLTSRKIERQSKADLPMASMIDVTFLLLIYFMTTTGFTYTERNLDSAIKVKSSGWWWTYTDFEHVGGAAWDLATSEWSNIDGIYFEARYDDYESDQYWYWYDNDPHPDQWKTMNDDYGTWGTCPMGWYCKWAKEESGLSSEDFPDNDPICRLLLDNNYDIIVYLCENCVD